MRVDASRVGLWLTFFYSTILCIFGSSEDASFLPKLAALALVAFFLFTVLWRLSFGRFYRFWIPYIALTIWAVLSLTWSMDPQVDRALTLAQVVFGGLIGAQIVARTGGIWAIEYGVYIGLFYSALAGGAADLAIAERYGGSFGHANDLATAAIGAMLFGVRHAVQSTESRRLQLGRFFFALVVFGLCAYLIFYSSGSRRGVLVFVLSLSYVFLAWASGSGSTPRKIAAISAVALLMLLSAPLVIESSFFFRVESLVSYVSGEGAIRESSVLERAGMVDEALALWWRSPLIGAGLDNFRLLSGFFTYSHNNYLELLTGLGVVGVLLFYIPLVSSGGKLLYLARCSWLDPSQRVESRWLLMFVVVLLVSDIFAVSYYDKVGWLLIAVALGHSTWLWRSSRLSRLAINE